MMEKDTPLTYRHNTCCPLDVKVLSRSPETWDLNDSPRYKRYSPVENMAIVEATIEAANRASDEYWLAGHIKDVDFTLNVCGDTQAQRKKAIQTAGATVEAVRRSFPFLTIATVTKLKKLRWLLVKANCAWRIAWGHESETVAREINTLLNARLRAINPATAP